MISSQEQDPKSLVRCITSSGPRCIPSQTGRSCGSNVHPDAADNLTRSIFLNFRSFVIVTKGHLYKSMAPYGPGGKFAPA